MSDLTYTAITPTRNEASNLRRLAPCMIEQEARPERWLIVDNGSTDATVAIANELSAEHPWISVLEIPGARAPTRGAPIVRAFHAGLAALKDVEADVVVKLDADVSFDSDYFARQLGVFASSPDLGISAGVCLERNKQGEWVAVRVTRGHVRGAVRAYRRECLPHVLPLEERIGWDGVDELRAQANGWQILTVPDLSFHHHRVFGARESTWFKWKRQGEMAHFMGYRASYLLVRTAYHVTREPQAVATFWGYGVARIRRQPRCTAEDAMAYLRKQQSVAALPSRVREKLGLAGRASDDAGLGDDLAVPNRSVGGVS